MQIKKVSKLVLVMDEDDAKQLAPVLSKLNEIDEAVAGDCQSCPLSSPCAGTMQRGVCYIHAVKFMLELLSAGQKTENSKNNDEILC